MNYEVMSAGRKIRGGLGHAAERKTGAMLARRNGRRADESCPLLMAKLSAFPAARYYNTDAWQSCREVYSALGTYCRKN